MDKIRLPENLKETASGQERIWIEKRFAQMSPKEMILMEAAMKMVPVNTMADMINLTFQLGCYELYYPVKDDWELGEYVALYLEDADAKTLIHTDLEELGRSFRASTAPGIFTGGAYVFPDGQKKQPVYDGTNLSGLEDRSYSVKIRLTSAFNKEGVWLRLPDYEKVYLGKMDELRISLDSLGVSALEECTAEEAICVLPNITNLLGTFGSLGELIWNGSNLGYIMDEQSQSLPNFMEHFLAAMEYEHCDRLDSALDISQNLHCYNFVLVSETVAEYGRKAAFNNGMIYPGTVSGECFAAGSDGDPKFQNAGMTLTPFGYVSRNENEFCYEYSQEPEEPELSM